MRASNLNKTDHNQQEDGNKKVVLEKYTFMPLDRYEGAVPVKTE